MTRIVKSIEIEAPREEVWKIVAYPENLPKFIDGIEDYEILSDNRVGVGAKYRWRARYLGKEVKIKEEITEWEENKRVSYKGLGRWDYDFTVEIASSNSKTKLTLDWDYEFESPLLKLLDKIFLKRMVKNPSKKALENAKELLEKEINRED